jgi:hypothetical protein
VWAGGGVREKLEPTSNFLGSLPGTKKKAIIHHPHEYFIPFMTLPAKCLPIVPLCLSIPLRPVNVAQKRKQVAEHPSYPPQSSHQPHTHVHTNTYMHPVSSLPRLGIQCLARIHIASIDALHLRHGGEHVRPVHDIFIFPPRQAVPEPGTPYDAVVCTCTRFPLRQPGFTSKLRWARDIPMPVIRCHQAWPSSSTAQGRPIARLA